MQFHNVSPEASPYHLFEQFFPLPDPPPELFPEVSLNEQLVIPGLEVDDDHEFE